MPIALLISWGGSADGDPSSDAAALGGAAIHLYPWNADGPLEDGRYPVAVTIKENTSMVSAVISSIGDFARAISSLMEGPVDPCDLRAIVGYGWAGSTIGSAVKAWLGIPLISSLGDSAPAGQDLHSLSIRALEMRSAHASDLVLARTHGALARARYSYALPADRVQLASSPKEFAAALSRYLGP